MKHWREMSSKETSRNHTMLIPNVLMIRAASLSSFSVSAGKAEHEKSIITMSHKTDAKVI